MTVMKMGEPTLEILCFASFLVQQKNVREVVHLGTVEDSDCALDTVNLLIRFHSVRRRTINKAIMRAVYAPYK